MAKKHLQDEYLDVSENFRHFGNLSLAYLTVYIAILAGLLIVNFQSSGDLSETVSVMAKIAGILSGIVFWVIEERLNQYRKHLARRAVIIEKELDFHQYSSAPKRRIITSTNAIRLFHISALVFWVLTIIDFCFGNSLNKMTEYSCA